MKQKCSKIQTLSHTSHVIQKNFHCPAFEEGLGTGQILPVGFFPFCRIDLVLVSGDIANMAMDVDNKATPEEVAQHHRNLEQVVEKFTAISSKVYFIPGNVG